MQDHGQNSHSPVLQLGNTLRILGCDRLGEVFHQTVMPLSYTPRRMAPLPPPSIAPDQLLEAQNQKIHLAILESDHNAYNEETRKEIRAALKKIQVSAAEDDDLTEEQIGTFKAGEGKWGSCIRIVDPAAMQTVEAGVKRIFWAKENMHMDDVRKYASLKRMIMIFMG